MEDQELQQIRARRMAQLQASKGGMGSSGSIPDLSGMMGGSAGPKQEEDSEKQRGMEEQRHNMLFNILDGKARERLATIKIVNSQKGKMVEDMLLYQVRMGQRMHKVSESDLIKILEDIDDSQRPKTTISIQRRGSSLSDSDDDW